MGPASRPGRRRPRRLCALPSDSTEPPLKRSAEREVKVTSPGWLKPPSDASRKHALSLVNPQAQLILCHSRLQGCSPTATQKGGPAHPLALPVPSPGPAPEEEPLGLTGPYAQPSFFYLPLLLTPKQLSRAPCLLHFYFYFC